MKQKFIDFCWGLLFLGLVFSVFFIVFYRWVNEPVPNFEPQTEQAIIEPLVQINLKSAEIVPEIEIITKEEKELLAKLLWWECRGESLECQQAIAEVILNRVEDIRFPNTITEVIYSPGQFSPTTRSDFLNVTPTPDQYQAIFNSLTENRYPDNMLYFAGGFYHNWGNIKDYMQIDNTYFSLS